MDLSNKQVVQALLAKFKIGPKKSFGQNFLIDRSVLDVILKLLTIGIPVLIKDESVREKRAKFIFLTIDDIIGAVKKNL